MEDVNILIADSDTIFSERLARHFTENGLKVSVVEDVTAAFDRITGGRFESKGVP